MSDEFISKHRLVSHLRQVAECDIMQLRETTWGKAYKRAADDIERMRPDVLGWIGVEDRLPEDSFSVICASAAGVFPGFFGSHDRQWHFATGCCLVVGRHFPVKCWMPLPEPPEVGNG